MSIGLPNCVCVRVRVQKTTCVSRVGEEKVCVCVCERVGHVCVNLPARLRVCPCLCAEPYVCELRLCLCLCMHACVSVRVRAQQTLFVL